MVDNAVSKLAAYALQRGLIQPCEKDWAVNAILGVLKIGSYTDPGREWGEVELAPVLEELLDDAHRRGVLAEGSVVYRDLFDTELMGRLTPRPAQVIERFQALYREDPRKATDWYYKFSQDTNYIRRDRIAKDIQWKSPTPYGELDITINLSKPEKDPKAIAAAKNLPASAYPRCQLCAENEGYAGRVNHPARQNHRIVPITINGSPWFLQYSPYVYYNEHCICLNSVHTPMKIDRACFAKLLDFVGQFPHYFVGSNADLPIVGGSILSHDHFQGGRFVFAMERAPLEEALSFPGFPGVRAGIVRWPMSVIRLTSGDREQLIELADRILTTWRGYSDEAAGIFADSILSRQIISQDLARREGIKNTFIPELNIHLLHCRTTAVPHCRCAYLRLDTPFSVPDGTVKGAILLLAPQSGQNECVEVISRISMLLVEDKRFLQALQNGDANEGRALTEEALLKYFQNLIIKRKGDGTL